MADSKRYISVPVCVCVCVCWRGFSAIHMLIGAVRNSVSFADVMVRFRQFSAQTNATFTACKLLLTTEN